MAEVVAVPDFDYAIVIPDAGGLVVVPEAYGVKGDPGPPGPPGAGAQTHEIFEVATQDGAMTIALPNINAAAGLDVYINGVKQARSAFTVTNTLLTLPADLLIMTGDGISAVYQL